MKTTISIFVILIFLLLACENKNNRKYKALVKAELATGKRVDSIFFGIYLGMKKDDFYAHCWAMNKKGLFTDGQGNAAVLYRFVNKEFRQPVSMNFYPQFINNKINSMGVSFQYDGWAPWNKYMSSDSLQLDVLSLLKTWYKGGTKFIKMEDEKEGNVFIKVDGNRRILVGKLNESMVKVDYADLLTTPENSPNK